MLVLGPPHGTAAINRGNLIIELNGYDYIFIQGVADMSGHHYAFLLLFCCAFIDGLHHSSVETLDDTYHPPIEKEFPSARRVAGMESLGEGSMDRAKVGMYRKHLMSAVRQIGSTRPMILGTFGG